MTPTNVGPQGPPQWRARALLVLVWLMVSLAAGAPAAAETPPAVQVDLTTASVTGSAADGELVVAGTLTNTSQGALTEVAAHLWRSTVVLRSPGALRDALAAESGPLGKRMTAAGMVDPAGGADTPLGPGESRPFRVVARLADIDLASPDASYWVGVDVRARTAAGAPATTVGEGRTLITLPGSASVPVTSVVELSAVPRQLKPGLFSDEGLAEDLTGRLAGLLDAAARPGTSYVVDPALVAEVADMADGYRVATPDADPAANPAASTPGVHADAASAWLEDLRALRDGPAADGYRSLAARADVTGATALGLPGVLERAVAASEPADLAALPLLVTLDRVDTATLTAVAPLAAPVLTTQPEATGLLLTSPAPLVGARAVDRFPDSPVLAPTPLNRAAVLVALARADGGQVRLLRTEADAAVDQAAYPVWTSRRPLATVLSGTPAAGTRPLAASSAPAALTATTGPRVEALATDLAGYAGIAPSSGVDAIADAQASRAASQWWAEAPEGHEAYLVALEARVGSAAITRAITLDATPRFSMSSAESSFPVTVTNGLVDDITVRLVATTDNPQRIRFLDPGEVTIRGGSSQTVTLSAAASGNGVVTGTIHVETLDNRRLTPDVSIMVETTNLGRIAWVIVAVSAVVLVVSTALRIRKVRSQTRGSADG